MKNITTINRYKKLIENFSYLTLINIINKLLPLIIVPFIVRTVGVEKYGIITFALSVISYFILITQYSFTLTATKYISLHRSDIDKFSKHFNLVISIRVIFFVLIATLFLTVLMFLDISANEKEVFIFTFLLVFADVLMPLWFFRGMEDMKYIAVFNIIAKLFYAFSIYLFVGEKDDFVWIPLLNSISLIMVNVYALYFAIRKYKIKRVPPSLVEIKEELILGKDIFFSNISVSFYRTINIILLGLLTNYTAVGIYSLAEGLFMAYNSIIKSYTTVVYPHLAKYLDQPIRFYSQARKLFSFYVIILSLSSLILFVSSSTIIDFLYGEGHNESIEILKIFSIALLVEPLGGFFTAYLSLKSKYRVIRSITFKTMILNLLLVVPMIHIFQAKGVVYLFLLLSLIQVYLNIQANREIFSTKKE